MFKRIAVFAVVVLGYVLTGMALHAGQDADAPQIREALFEQD